MKNGNGVKNLQIKLDDFRNNGGNFWMNYLTEFDLYMDIVLILYMVCAKILSLFLSYKVIKRWCAFKPNNLIF